MNDDGANPVVQDDPAAVGDSRPAPSPLTDDERRMLDFAGLTWRYAGSRDAAIRDEFKMSATAFLQHINRLIEHPEALAYAPTTVKRLTRLRDERRWKRSIRSLRSA